MSWDFSTEPEFQVTLDWVRKFVDEKIIPMDLIIESENPTQAQINALIAPLQEEVKDRGLWAMHLPPEDGGEGIGLLKLALIHEVLGRSLVAPAVFGNQAPDSGNAELIAVGANEEQREKWLYPLVRGEMRSCFAMTEPHNSGSDPTGLQTLCVQEGDEWVINGHKWFASNATIADFLVVMVVTDPEAAPHQRAAMVIVPTDTPGLNILRDVGTMHHPEYHGDDHKMHRHGGHAEILFENCRVPLGNMIGKPGEGFILAQKRLGGGRIHHCMRMIGVCKRAFEMMTERAVSRVTKGKPLAQHQMVQDMIAESYAEIESARLLVMRAGWNMDHYGHSSEQALTDIAMTKFWVPRVLLNVLDRAIQIHGALGYTTDMPLESMYRLARSMRLADGADEVHKQTVCRKLLKHVDPVEGWPTEHVPTARKAAFKQYGDLLAEVKEKY